MTEAIVSEELKGGQLAKLAALFCAKADFRMFLMRRWPDADQIETPEQAAAWVKVVCDVKSRKEFDNDQAAADRFHDRVRIPYVQWQLGREV
jgi:hypothetical protein